MSNVFFIGDLHLDHKGIITKYGRSQFSSLDEHNEHLIDRWNSVVHNKRSLVWVLGDAAMSISAIKLFDRMIGRKILVAGNHDTYPTEEYLKYFEKVISFEKRYGGLVLTHIPVHVNEMNNRNWNYNIHGHIHSQSKQDEYDSRYINANADLIDLTPISLEEIREKINERNEN